MKRKIKPNSIFYGWNKKIWLVINIFFTMMYLTWRLFFTLPFGYGAVSVFFGAALLVVEFLGMIEALVHYYNMYAVNTYELPEVPLDRFPHVDIFIATYNEETDLLYKTVRACKEMEYPNLSKVHIYLCDDNRRPEMRELAKKLGVGYFDRPDNKGAKAGNLNNALKQTKSPYVVTFDADMIPQKEFLMKTMPYYVDCEIKNESLEEEDKVKLAILQTPQSFYNTDLFQFFFYSENRIPNEQDYFYKDIQVSRTKSNSVIYGGSNTVLSREALEDVGGFYEEVITEDFATGILIQKKQYVSLGINEPLTSGLSPDSLKDLVNQRIRWARGVIGSGRKLHIYTSKELSFAQKMNYWASIWYWYAPVKRLIYILCPILYATFGFIIFKCTLFQVLLFWLPMYITSNISLRLFSRNIRTTKWSGIYETIMFPFMLMPVIFETLGITMKKFKVTAKDKPKRSRKTEFVYQFPFIILIIMSVIGIISCIRIIFDSSNFGPVVVLFWLINNLFLMVMSMLFVSGRISKRKKERIITKVDCVVSDDIWSANGESLDISESGIAIKFDKPYYFNENEVLHARLRYKEYVANPTVQLLKAREKDDKWIYSFRILDYNGTYDDLLGILYDRNSTLPTNLKKDSGVFEDLKININKRVEPLDNQKRNNPRIKLNKTYRCVEPKYEKIKVHDFNYYYLTVSEASTIPNRFKIKIIEDIVLDCKYVKKAHVGYNLYSIINAYDIYSDRNKRRELLNKIIEDSKKEEETEINEIEANKEEMFDERELFK
ncbi:MAG TPA: glycosyltransferase family 2 protein [Anaerovoracaceae bacterium]|nr:glycosyltransferase family 2 protein [Anaerovoracaceae bacterium]